jgi:hypothetical protein
MIKYRPKEKENKRDHVWKTLHPGHYTETEELGLNFNMYEFLIMGELFRLNTSSSRVAQQKARAWALLQQ